MSTPIHKTNRGESKVKSKLAVTVIAAAALVATASPASAVTMPVAGSCNYSVSQSYNLMEPGPNYWDQHRDFGDLYVYESAGCNKTWAVAYVNSSSRWVRVTLFVRDNAGTTRSSTVSGTDDQVTGALTLKNSNGTKRVIWPDADNIDGDLYLM